MAEEERGPLSEFRRSGDPDAWRAWWNDPSAEAYYFMGKDNITFHAEIWPAMLLGYDGAGELGAGKGDLHLPTNVVASEYLTMEGKKASTSRNIAIWVSDFLSRYDPDPLRYYLTAGGPETQDTDFTWDEFVRRNNDELLANWGNLVNRTLTHTHRNFGAVPEPGELTDADGSVLDGVAAGFSSQALHELLGYDGWLAGPLEFRTATEDDGSTHEILTGEYESWVGSWAPSELPAGQVLLEPKPLFKKLAPETAAEELARLGIA